MGTDLPLTAAAIGGVIGRKSRWFIFIRSRLRELDEGGRLHAGAQSTRVADEASTRRNDGARDETNDVDAGSGRFAPRVQ